MKTAKLIITLFLVACLFSMCKKDSKKDTNSSNTEYYVQGTLNGQKWNWQVPADGTGYVVGSSSSLSNNQGVISGGVTTLVSGNGGYQPQLGVEFKTINKPMGSDAATVLSNFLTAGSWTYASDLAYTVGTKSVVVYYTDNNGKQYSSIGTQNQVSLNVLSVAPVTGSVYNANPGFKINLSFSCVLYPTDGTGGVLAAENVQATVFLDQTLL